MTGSEKSIPARGFGLIELLLVIAIIGLLAGLILSASSKGRVKAFDAGIKNAVRQVRWQAEIAFNTNNNSYKDFQILPLIHDELVILLEEVDKNYGESPDSPYVTIIRDNQINDFCVSAPSRAEPGMHYCIDAGGEVRLTNAECPEQADDGPPLACP